MKTSYLVNIKMDLEMSNLTKLSNLWINKKTNWTNLIEEIFSFAIFLRECKLANPDFLSSMKNLSKIIWHQFRVIETQDLKF